MIKANKFVKSKNKKDFLKTRTLTLLLKIFLSCQSYNIFKENTLLVDNI